MKPDQAKDDLRYIREIVSRAGERLDPHLFHTVHWGAIVLVWYPLSNLFQMRDRKDLMLILGIAALTLGAVLSAALEWRLKGRSRVTEGNEWIERRIGWFFAAFLGAGGILSGIAPSVDPAFIPGPRIPSLWGLVYAALAFSVGVLYTREWRISGGLIFAGTIFSLFFLEYNGFILGPVMGFGMILPGLAAERRVRRLRSEGSEEAGGP